MSLQRQRPLTAAGIVGGVRIPFCRNNTAYVDIGNQAMSIKAVSALVERYGLAGAELGEVGPLYATVTAKAADVTGDGYDELLLGYRDNLGSISPLPRGKGEDIGRNGTFLVIRQLEQHKDVFRKYVKKAALALEGDPRVQGLSGADLKHWVSASMVGRWKDERDLVARAQALRAKLRLDALLLTRGEDGMTLFRPGRTVRIKGEPRDVADVTGAGDTVIGVLAVMLAAGESMESAARLANRAGGIKVTKFGTAVVTRDELFGGS